MKDGYRVKYDNDNQICIIPYNMPLEDFIGLIKMYSDMGFKYWLPADERQGYILSKKGKE